MVFWYRRISSNAICFTEQASNLVYSFANDKAAPSQKLERRLFQFAIRCRPGRVARDEKAIVSRLKPVERQTDDLTQPTPHPIAAGGRADVAANGESEAAPG
jgi:hypothetical protein